MIYDNISEVLLEHGENSSILSPAWQTSGITNGSQVLSGTAGISFLPGAPSTAIEYYGEFTEFLDIEKIELLNKESPLIKSIEIARKELRKGGPYLAHDDVFKD